MTPTHQTQTDPRFIPPGSSYPPTRNVHAHTATDNQQWQAVHSSSSSSSSDAKTNNNLQRKTIPTTKLRTSKSTSTSNTNPSSISNPPPPTPPNNDFNTEPPHPQKHPKSPQWPVHTPSRHNLPPHDNPTRKRSPKSLWRSMKAKALFRLTDDWLDVTPSFALRKNQVDTADERAWQRDIGKFRKKAPSKLLSHKLRETIVARIPAEAGDGYFQLNLCQRGKKKVLCSSPVFRVLSTSLDPSSLRGASLTTMPLEVGAMVLGMYAQTAAQAVLNPVTAKITNRLDAIKPGLAKQTAAESAFTLSGMQDRIARSGTTDQEGRAKQLQEYQQGASLENGPQPPFPIDFKPRIQAPFLDESPETPRYSLTKVSDNVLDKLRGYYLAWARVDPQPPSQPEPPNWHPTILSLTPPNLTHQTNLTLSRALTTPKTTLLRFLSPTPLAPTTKLQIRVMCFLRPDIPLPSPTAMTEQDLLAVREAAAEAEILADACD
ncbi:hypothetical protein BBP40_002034, partial [Aspergillus hancockii]